MHKQEVPYTDENDPTRATSGAFFVCSCPKEVTNLFTKVMLINILTAQLLKDV